MINLLSNDVGRFDIALAFINYFWIGPFQTIIVTYLLWQKIGVSSLFGIAILICFIPLQGMLNEWLPYKLWILMSAEGYIIYFAFSLVRENNWQSSTEDDRKNRWKITFNKWNYFGHSSDQNVHLGETFFKHFKKC